MDAYIEKARHPIHIIAKIPKACFLLDVRDSLRFQLEKLIDEKTEQIVYEFSDGLVASNWVKKHPGEIDLLFLDIEMQKQNGMETAKIIREYDKNIAFAFVTGYTEYVYEGYEVEAIGYFIKPISLKQLHTLLERMRKKLRENDKDDFYCFKNTDGTYRLSKKDIFYLESDKRQIPCLSIPKNYHLVVLIKKKPFRHLQSKWLRSNSCTFY